MNLMKDVYFIIMNLKCLIGNRLSLFPGLGLLVVFTLG